MHVALNEDRGHVGVEADCEQDCRDFDSPGADDSWLFGDGECVQINNSVERVVVMLTGDPLPKRSEIDAEMGVTSRLKA